jgi:16S rRNA (cytosine967-C5)-methyltransferase
MTAKSAETPAQIRARAARVVAQVADSGKSLDALLSAGPIDASDAQARGLTRSLVYGTIRWQIRLSAVLAKLSARPPQELDSELRALLLVGIYQLLHTDIAAHAAVAETVEAARALKQPRAAGFVNAILRRCQREGSAMASSLDNDAAVRTAHPQWFVAQLKNDWPDRYATILDANNQHPPLWLRVNRRRGTVTEYLQRLIAAGHPAEIGACAPESIRLLDPVDVRRLPDFDLGAVSVQDAAAQLAAHLLDAQLGQRVLDACAAPGGKTCHVLELEPGIAELIAVDVSAGRLRRVEENLTRLQLRATLIAGDAADPSKWWDGKHFHRILLDVPCSATGVIRRHPDIKLLRRSSDIPDLAREQARMLSSAWPLLAPGGRLLYASCSALRAENAEVVSAFLTAQPDARDATAETVAARLPACGAYLAAGAGPGRAIAAGEAQMDGFYYACLDKAAT